MWPSPVFACHGWYRSTKLCKRQLVSSWSCARWSIISYISLGCTLPTLLTLPGHLSVVTTDLIGAYKCPSSQGLSPRRSNQTTLVDPSAHVLAGVTVDGCLSQVVRTDMGMHSHPRWSAALAPVNRWSLWPVCYHPDSISPPSVSGVDGKLTWSLWCLVFFPSTCPGWSCVMDSYRSVSHA